MAGQEAHGVFPFPVGSSGCACGRPGRRALRHVLRRRDVLECARRPTRQRPTRRRCAPVGLLDRISSPVGRAPAQRGAGSTSSRPRSATFLVESVSRTGGHLGPNLGVVELTIALHRVFESPRDRMVFDTGHQAYVHKLAHRPAPTSRACAARGGLSGYPSRAESEHDVVENSHASTALSLGGRHRQGQRAAGPRRPARRRRHRRRRAHRRHGLGGAQQHRRGPGPPPRHRRQRQRPLLRADDRRPRAPPGHPAHHAGLRERAALGQAHAAARRRARARSRTTRCTG